MEKSVPDEVVGLGFEAGDFSHNKTGWPEPSAFIQWKGTDVCMDFHCECGAFCHLDAAFAYTVQCPHCQTVWEMPSTIYPRKADDRTYAYWRENPQMLEPDGDLITEKTDG
jgi:hypothetical protein